MLSAPQQNIFKIFIEVIFLNLCALVLQFQWSNMQAVFWRWLVFLSCWVVLGGVLLPWWVQSQSHSDGLGATSMEGGPLQPPRPGVWPEPFLLLHQWCAICKSPSLFDSFRASQVNWQQSEASHSSLLVSGDGGMRRKQAWFAHHCFLVLSALLKKWNLHFFCVGHWWGNV